MTTVEQSATLALACGGFMFVAGYLTALRQNWSMRGGWVGIIGQALLSVGFGLMLWGAFA